MTRKARNFKSLHDAFFFHNSLYDQYEHVRLIASPRFSEDGEYVWEVAKPF